MKVMTNKNLCRDCPHSMSNTKKATTGTLQACARSRCKLLIPIRVKEGLMYKIQNTVPYNVCILPIVSEPCPPCVCSGPTQYVVCTSKQLILCGQQECLVIRTPHLDLGQSWGPIFTDTTSVNCSSLPIFIPRQVPTLRNHRAMSSSTSSQSINPDIVTRVSFASRPIPLSLRCTDDSLWSCAVHLVRANPPYWVNYSKTILDNSGSLSRILPEILVLERRMEGNTISSPRMNL
jgi:hypothetical protein